MTVCGWVGNEKQLVNKMKGYIYELFSIIIHDQGER